MSSPTLTHDEITQRLKAVTDYVQDCERRVNKGEIMDLQGLDNNVVILCEAVTSLPKDEALKFEARMTALITGLDLLAASIKAQHEKFSATGKK